MSSGDALWLLRVEVSVMPPRKQYRPGRRRRRNTGRSCGKVRYRDQREAMQALRRLRAASGGQIQRAYECDQCHGWHLTSQQR